MSRSLSRIDLSNSRIKGVHATHCCTLHGCKYGYDNCPVESGDVAQEYPCEDCPKENNMKQDDFIWDEPIPKKPTEVNPCVNRKFTLNLSDKEIEQLGWSGECEFETTIASDGKSVIITKKLTESEQFVEDVISYCKKNFPTGVDSGRLMDAIFEVSLRTDVDKFKASFILKTYHDLNSKPRKIFKGTN